MNHELTNLINLDKIYKIKLILPMILLRFTIINKIRYKLFLSKI